jgi:hypothetical protein
MYLHLNIVSNSVTNFTSTTAASSVHEERVSDLHGNGKI